MKEYKTTLEIREIYFELNPSETLVANYILKNIEEVPTLSIGKLSEIINVSQPTIIRFVKKMGYDGYRVFKDNIIKDIATVK